MLSLNEGSDWADRRRLANLVKRMQAISTLRSISSARLHDPQFTEQRRQLPLQGCLVPAELPAQVLCKEGIERTPQNELDVLILSRQGSGGISRKARITDRIGALASLARLHPGEDRRFKGRNAPQPPENTDNPVSQLTLDHAFRHEFVKNALTHFEELFGAFGGE